MLLCMVNMRLTMLGKLAMRAHVCYTVAQEGGVFVEKPLTVPEVAELLHLTPETVRRLVRKGHLRAVKVGRSLLISPSELAKLLATGTTPVGRRKAGAQAAQESTANQ